MSSYLLANHLLNFVFPAAFMAALMALCAPFVTPKSGFAHNWWAQLAINFIVGMLVLVAGLALFGREGRMLSYAALALAMAASQWLRLGGWKR